jgi:hypothetical protein
MRLVENAPTTPFAGYALANAGHDTRRIQDWLGHRSIQHTTRYTQLSAAPFKLLEVKSRGILRAKFGQNGGPEKQRVRQLAEP